jgi:butyryl-CoA dehydrogenase
LEQYYRDARINPIHEGTTGIHGIDLLGRKVLKKNGKASQLYLAEARTAVEVAAKSPRLEPYARELAQALDKLTSVTSHLIGISQQKGPEHFLSDATLYLELFGIVSIAWQWLLQAIAAQKALDKDLPVGEQNFYKGKFNTFRYFFGYELPKIEGLIKRLMNTDGLTVEMDETLFQD